MGINNFIIGGQTAAQVESALQTQWQLFKVGIPIYQTALNPWTTSSDQFQTLVNQTLSASSADINTVDTWIRGKPYPLAGYFDPATTTNSSANSGLWIVSGAVKFYTNDGIHPNQNAVALIVSNNTIPSATFTWPQ